MTEEVYMMKISKAIRRWWKKVTPGWVAVYTLMTALALVTSLPLVYMVVTAFKPIEELLRFPPRFFVERPVLTNFADLFQSLDGRSVPFTRYLFNSLFTTAASVILTLAFCAMGAFAVEKVRMRGSKLFSSMIVYALMFSAPAAQIPIYMSVAQAGLMNTYAALIIPGLATPMYFFLMKQFISQLPEPLMESARLDGASETRILVSIVVPSIKPALATVAVFAFIGNWNNTTGSAIYIQDQAMKTLPYALSTISSGGLARAGAAAAASLIITLPTIIVYLLMQTQVMKTMLHAGIK